MTKEKINELMNTVNATAYKETKPTIAKDNMYINNKPVGFSSDVYYRKLFTLKYVSHKLMPEQGIVEINLDSTGATYNISIPKKALRELMLGLI